MPFAWGLFMTLILAGVGSINLDLVASDAPLPRPGETVMGAAFTQIPGGKGANQVLAGARLGAKAVMVGCVGEDILADQALSLLQEAEVNLSYVQHIKGIATGVALISVSPEGENQITVASGANLHLADIEAKALTDCDAVLCQLEIPVDAIMTALALAPEKAMFAVNLAPALEVPEALLQAADLLIVNEIEAAFYGDQLHTCSGMVAVTLGERGAVLYRAGEEIARVPAFKVDVVDTTGAGDTFCAGLVVGLGEGKLPQEALQFASAAAALAVTKAGAQTSIPSRDAVEAFLQTQA